LGLVGIERLKGIVGAENVKDDKADLYVYGSDASVHEAMPWVVVRPHTIEEVQSIMRYANSELIPVIPRGSASSTSGHTVPIDGGIIMDLKGMNKILEIRPENIYCKVEPGVIDDGLRSVKYGATRDVVLGMKVVLANGDLITLGSNTRVTTAGYRLMVGSEGTLGIVVEATLKIVPIPKYRCLGIAKFNKLEEAGNAVSEIMSIGIGLSMLELMDNIAITAVNKAQNLGLPDVEAILLFEADGMVKEAVDIEISKIIEICKKQKGFGIDLSYDVKERTRIYTGRKKLFASLSRYKEGIICTDTADDMAIPNSKVSECAHMIHEIAKKNNVIMSVYGHCGSGVVHTKIMFDVTKKSQWNDANRAATQLYEYVHSVGGTTSGEHGIGLSKAPFWKKEKADSLNVMKQIKKALDPNNILNPHKLQDAPDDWLTATKLRYQVKN
jgi:glycolate oxidase